MRRTGGGASASSRHGVVAEVGGPVQRCAGTTRNPDSGQVDLKTLALIGDYRGRQDSVFGMGFNFGVYATRRHRGPDRVGDALELLGGRRCRQRSSTVR